MLHDNVCAMLCSDKRHANLSDTARSFFGIQGNFD